MQTCDCRGGRSVKLAHKIFFWLFDGVSTGLKCLCEAIRILICQDFVSDGWRVAYTREHGRSCRWMSARRLLFSAEWRWSLHEAADVGADPSGKNEYGLEVNEKRNPGCIVDHVSDRVGGVAGVGADLLGFVR